MNRPGATLTSLLDRFPQLKSRLRPWFYRLKGEPVVCLSPIAAPLLRECLGTETPTIIEIGCHEGDTTQWLLQAFAQPAIHCFEPDPRAAARFRQTLGGNPHVHLTEAAIGSRDGTATFHMSGGNPSGEAGHRDWDASGSLHRPTEHFSKFPWCTFEKSITVPVHTLDSWAREAGIATVDFIWMDVQGAELDVIEGGAATLERTRFLYTEYGAVELYEGQPSLKRLMHALGGFELLVRYPDDALFANRLHVHASEQRRWRELFSNPGCRA